MTVENANSKITVWTRVVFFFVVVVVVFLFVFFPMREKTAALNAKQTNRRQIEPVAPLLHNVW